MGIDPDRNRFDHGVFNTDGNRRRDGSHLPLLSLQSPFSRPLLCHPLRRQLPHCQQKLDRDRSTIRVAFIPYRSYHRIGSFDISHALKIGPIP